MAAESDLSGIDDKVLSLADRLSPEEISREIGGVLSPAGVRVRLKHLLGARDWLEAVEQEQLILRRMNKVIDELEGQTRHNLDAAKVLLQYLKASADRLDKRAAAREIDLNTYHVNVGREMARVYDIALGYIKGALREEIDPLLWDEVAREALTHARAELAKKAVDGDGKAVEALS